MIRSLQKSTVTDVLASEHARFYIDVVTEASDGPRTLHYSSV